MKSQKCQVSSGAMGVGQTLVQWLTPKGVVLGHTKPKAKSHSRQVIGPMPVSKPTGYLIWGLWVLWVHGSCLPTLLFFTGLGVPGKSNTIAQTK